jgi:hypothetical protein
VPGDAKVVGHTWLKASKDGSPDRRLTDNYQIPIVAYAFLTLKSWVGLIAASLGWIGTCSTRAEWRALRSARVSTLEFT